MNPRPLSAPTGHRVLLVTHPAHRRTRHTMHLIASAAKLWKVLHPQQRLQHSTAPALNCCAQTYLFLPVPGRSVCSSGPGWSCGVQELPVPGARNRDTTPLLDSSREQCTSGCGTGRGGVNSPWLPRWPLEPLRRQVLQSFGSPAAPGAGSSGRLAGQPASTRTSL